MKEVEQPVLMPIHADSKFIDGLAKIIRRGATRFMAYLLQITQRAPNLRPMRFHLRPNVFERRLIACRGAVKLDFTPQANHPQYTAYMLLIQEASYLSYG